VLGAGLVGAGYAIAIPLLDGSRWLVVVSLLVGAGLGPAYTAMSALIASAVPASQLAAVNGVNTLMRQIGSAASGAFASAVFTALHVRVQVNGGTIEYPSSAGLSLALLAACAACAAVALTAAVIGNEPTRRTSRDRRPVPVGRRPVHPTARSGGGSP
jgi:MFS family permease